MRKICLLVVVALVALSCGGRAKKATESVAEVQAAVRSLTDSIRLVDGGGPVVLDVYAGEIPAADGPGRRLHLSLYHQEFLPYGVYKLETTYFEAEDGKDRTDVTTGEWGSIDTEVPHPIYVLTDYVAGDKMNFAYRGATLDMLDQNRQPIVSEFNYSLARESDGVKVPL